MKAGSESGGADRVESRRRVLRELDEAVGSLAHELSQPLSAISLVSQGLQLSLDTGSRISEEELRSSIDIMIKQAELMSGLIDQVRSYACGVLSAGTEIVDLCELTGRAGLMCSAQLKKRGIALESVPNPEPLLVDVNPHAVEDCVILLLRQARDAIMRSQGPSAETGVIRLATISCDGMARIEVAVCVPWIVDDSPKNDTLEWVRLVAAEQRGGFGIDSDDSGRVRATLSLPLAAAC